MALFIDTSATVPFELEGTTFQIRVLPGRKLMRLFGLLDSAQGIIGDRKDEEISEATFSPSDLAKIQAVNFEIMQAGIDSWSGMDSPTEHDLDTITPNRWSDLVAAIVDANRVSEDDRKNSPSA